MNFLKNKLKPVSGDHHKQHIMAELKNLKFLDFGHY